MTRHIRDAVATDHDAVLALNNSATPHVNALSEVKFAWLVEHAEHFRVCEDEAGLAGFVLTLRSGLKYWSENYQWFSARYDDFLYLDRVVVADRIRGQGVGRAIYHDLQTLIGAQWPRIVLEVNLRPANPASAAFHEHVGFRHVGIREHADGREAVTMMERAT